MIKLLESKKKKKTDITPNLKFGRKGKSHKLTSEQSVATKFHMWSKQEKQEVASKRKLRPRNNVARMYASTPKNSTRDLVHTAQPCKPALEGFAFYKKDPTGYSIRLATVVRISEHRGLWAREDWSRARVHGGGSCARSPPPGTEERRYLFTQAVLWGTIA